MPAEHFLIQPKRPDSPDWKFIDMLQHGGFPAERWLSRWGHVAITAVEVPADEPGQEHIGPEYHVSFSVNGQRIPADYMQSLLKIFGMEGATEDNHAPNGIARNFWKPVAEQLTGIECPCKDEEPAIVEGDYTWRPATDRRGNR